MNTIPWSSVSSWLPTIFPAWPQLVLIVVTLVLFFLAEFRILGHKSSARNVTNLPEAPSPVSIPVIGHIYKLAAYPDNAWEGFNAIRKQYGDVVRLRLGQYQAVMVSSVEAVREVLLVKGESFGDRPQFHRHALIFGRNIQNALALCDWSEVHKVRRSIAHAAIIPRFGSDCFKRLSCSIDGTVHRLFDEMRSMQSPRLTKQRLNLSCVEIFIEFLLEQRVDINDPMVKEVAARYDFIFYDINQMYLSDFIPQLSICARRYHNMVEHNATALKNFISDQVMPRLENLIQQRKEKQETKSSHKTEAEKGKEKSFDEDRFVDEILLNKQYNSSARFLDFVLNHFVENPKDMSWEECLYEIGDLVGGNSAVSNLLMRVLGWLALNEDVQDDIYREIVSNHHDSSRVSLEERVNMPLLNAAIMETLRLASSPIVPHMARQDTSIQGYFIPKNTMVLFNIYHLNLSPNFWQDPRRFNPARFVTDCGSIVKPDYFFPFSHGRRSCLGYKMVNSIIFTIVANILLNHRVVAGDESNRKLMVDLLQPKGTVALPYQDGKCYELHLAPRD